MAPTGAQKPTTDSASAQSTPRNADGVAVASAGASTEWMSRSDRRTDWVLRSSWGARWAAMRRSSAAARRVLRARGLALVAGTTLATLLIACDSATPAAIDGPRTPTETPEAASEVLGGVSTDSIHPLEAMAGASVPATDAPPASVAETVVTPEAVEAATTAAPREMPSASLAAASSVISVNATHDAVDALPGDAVCADANGACTLRAAVQEANASGGGITVELPPGAYVLSIAGAGEDAAASGDLDITAGLTLTGTGGGPTAIDASGLDRALDVHGATVVVANLAIRGGATDQENGGGIRSAGALSLSAVELTDNIADGHGGAIAALGGSLELSGVVVQGNRAAGSGGGIWLSSGNLLVTSSSVTSNAADDEGGGVSTSGRASIVDSIVIGNEGGAGGGGVHNGGSLSLERATVDGNRDAGGGGLLNEARSMLLRGTSVRGNEGGGILIAGGALEVLSSTVSGNLIEGEAVDILTDPLHGGTVVVGTGSSVGVCESCEI